MDFGTDEQVEQVILSGVIQLPFFDCPFLPVQRSLDERASSRYLHALEFKKIVRVVLTGALVWSAASAERRFPCSAIRTASSPSTPAAFLGLAAAGLVSAPPKNPQATAIKKSRPNPSGSCTCASTAWALAGGDGNVAEAPDAQLHLLCASTAQTKKRMYKGMRSKACLPGQRSEAHEAREHQNPHINWRKPVGVALHHRQGCFEPGRPHFLRVQRARVALVLQQAGQEGHLEAFQSTKSPRRLDIATTLKTLEVLQ